MASGGDGPAGRFILSYSLNSGYEAYTADNSLCCRTDIESGA